ncbi:MAG TPA: alpha-galactosidase [Propionibacteriaceae bacterium]
MTHSAAAVTEPDLGTQPRTIDPTVEPFLHLRSAGVSVLLDLEGGSLPAVRHWGADLGPLTAGQLGATVAATRASVADSRMDFADRIALVPERASGWLGRPGLEGGRTGRDWSSVFTVDRVVLTADPTGDQHLRVQAVDRVSQLELTIELELTTSGLLRLRAVLFNAAPESYSVGALRLVLPVPAQAVELLDFTGRHVMERIPQRQTFTKGVHSRESRQGRPGLDSAYLLMAGTAHFGFRHGEVWGVHLGWSGNHNVYAEQISNGARVLGSAELLERDEVRLGEGEAYVTPWTYAGYGIGTDAVADRFHALLRARPGHPSTPRPVLVNTWEAVYFDHDLPKLKALADRAALIGAERFVLDDGWFGGRRDDTSSLGDWVVSPDMWPDGLGPLVDHVTGLGLQFGLWFEPEMVSLDSDLGRAHPEWLFSAGGRVGLPSRQQHVLDLGHPGAYAYIRDAILAILERYAVSYIKWDHNRNLSDAGHTPEGTPGVHAHTLAVYRLFDELRAAHPDLEIESCAGGGGRIDLGIMQRADRVWASDCIDALERQQIQRYTQLLLPPELIGTHIGASQAHTTLRRHDLSFRAQTALWGHLGIEWDLTSLSPAELDELAGWVALHKRLRPLLHTGTVVNLDHPDPAIWVNGVVSADRRDAVFGVVAVRRSETWPPGRLALSGLDPDLDYAVRLAHPVDGHELTRPLPAWATAPLTLPGRVLMSSGVELLPVHPEHGYLLRVMAAV